MLPHLLRLAQYGIRKHVASPKSLVANVAMTTSLAGGTVSALRDQSPYQGERTFAAAGLALSAAGAIATLRRPSTLLSRTGKVASVAGAAGVLWGMNQTARESASKAKTEAISQGNTVWHPNQLHHSVERTVPDRRHQTARARDIERAQRAQRSADATRASSYWTPTRHFDLAMLAAEDRQADRDDRAERNREKRRGEAMANPGYKNQWSRVDKSTGRVHTAVRRDLSVRKASRDK
jgi:hypothetical protein